MEPCVFRLPFPHHYPDTDEGGLLARVQAFFAPQNVPGTYNKPQATGIITMLQNLDFPAYSNPQQIRNFIINNLLLVAASATSDAARTKALELLGKTKDVALFEERTSVLVEHMTTEEIKERLAEKAKRLRERTVDAEVVDTTPTQPQEN